MVVYSLTFVNTIQDAAEVFLSSTLDTSMICTAVPSGLPKGETEATFIVDLESVPVPRRQCAADTYAPWGQARGDWEVVAWVGDQVGGRRKEGDVFLLCPSPCTSGRLAVCSREL